MKKLHRKFRERFRWYDFWHNHEHHELYHWILLFLFSVLVGTNVFLNVKGSLGKIDELKRNIKRFEAPLSQGRAVGISRDHILVTFETGIPETKKKEVLDRHNLKEESEIKEIDLKIVKLPAAKELGAALQELQNEVKNGFLFAEIDVLLEPSFIPNDPDYINEWHHPKINSPLAWESTKGENVVIAIADTGVDANHPELSSRLVPGWNFTNNNSDTSDVYGHGTEVAGASAALGNNNYGVAGVAWNAKIMPLRISDLNGNAYYSAIANAIVYAADYGAKIVNVSYQAGGSAAVDRAARYMKRKGGLVVIAEGNGGNDAGYKNSGNIISVSATDDYDTRANWSSYGLDVDVSSPGQAIYTTTRGGGADYFSGTSFSAPIVSGLLALIWSANPSLSPDEIQNILFNSVDDLGAPGWDQFYGWGRINAGQAILSPNTSIRRK